MGVMDDVLSEIDKDEEERSGFGQQLMEGFIRTGTLGYRGDPDEPKPREAPSDLPLSGTIGRHAGELLGFAPALAVGELGATAIGARGLLRELGIGFVYGMAEKPEDAEADIWDRTKKGLETSALFGAGYGVFKGLGALGKKIFGPDDLDKLLAKGAEGKGPSGEINPSRVAAPYSTESKFQEFKSNIPEPPYSGGPEDLQKIMETESTFGGGMVKPPIQETLEEQVSKSQLYEGHVNSWAKNILKHVPPEAEFLERAGKLAIDSSNLDEASMSMMRDSVKHAMGETPKVVDDVVEAFVPKIETRAALEENIERIVLKNDLPIEVVQAAIRTTEPINRLMVEGLNFEDAAQLTDDLAARAKLTIDPETIGKEVSEAMAGPPPKMPSWITIKKRNFSPEDIVDLFYNVPIKGPAAIKHGLIELETKAGGLRLTPDGYSFLKKYNPNGLMGVFPPGMDRQIVGAIRGRGYSDINLSPSQVKEAGLLMHTKKGVEQGLLRPAMKGGKEIPEMYQLEEKGAGMLAGGKGAHANAILKEWDIAAGLRVARTDLAGQALLKAENERTELLFRDILEQTANMGKKCD